MDGHQPRMLLVEDHQATRHAIRRILTRRGWEVLEAGTIAEAVDQLDFQRPPACVLLDLGLPDGGGEAILRQIRTGGMPTRVVINSGVQDEARLDEVSYLRPDAVLRKPTDPERLCRICEAVQQGRQAHDRRGAASEASVPELRGGLHRPRISPTNRGARPLTGHDNSVRMLIVEDDAVTCSLMRDLLGGLGMEVLTAHTVADGIALLGCRPDYVLLDRSLPDGDGREVLERVRRDRLPSRVIVTTGWEATTDMGAAKPDAILSKPVDLGRLFEILGVAS